MISLVGMKIFPFGEFGRPRGRIVRLRPPRRGFDPACGGVHEKSGGASGILAVLIAGRE